MILRPSKPATESIAEVGYSGSLVYAYLPEKHDGFRAVVRGRDLTWDWGRRQYTRLPASWAGPAADRAAELGHVLLNAGFVVEIADELAEMLLAVSYTPERRRVISASGSSEYRGWFRLRWPRDDDHWVAARQLPGNRYDPPAVVVPPGQFEAVQDFAERYDFLLTPGAQRLIDETVARKRAALIVDVPALPDTRARQTATPQPPTTADGIALELADDEDDLDDDH